ncbi:hypothetical protein GPECTOR_28g796 [Gonium pectorale]|uniref:Peptidase M11 gametolysin domain-containing protein n=1 Tax=Gonium pectorale TaxID=33097 RepID=A0A150GEW4_GONPE|nr:hypothetical protein GPECTOR_28g796 [Gonium pectorale]|eukprot:KXZ48389.1 hypothetical protein GPECTOR_28g796 [Gonium pectorale]
MGAAAVAPERPAEVEGVPAGPLPLSGPAAVAAAVAALHAGGPGAALRVVSMRRLDPAPGAASVAPSSGGEGWQGGGSGSRPGPGDAAESGTAAGGAAAAAEQSAPNASAADGGETASSLPGGGPWPRARQRRLQQQADGRAVARRYLDPRPLNGGELSTLFVIVDLCGLGAGPAVGREDLESLLFEPASSPSSSPPGDASGGSTAQSLEGYVDTCSLGSARLSRSNSRVVGPYKLPCSYTAPSAGATDSDTARDADAAGGGGGNGAADGVIDPREAAAAAAAAGGALSWTAYGCSVRDVFGWADAAAAAAVADGVEPSRYSHLLLVLPPGMRSWAGPACSWTGLATVGPAVVRPDGLYGQGYAWISGDYARTLPSYLHELGHNLWLSHAGLGSCPDCDWSCTMGLCCRTRCFNGPHSWQLGWAAPAPGAVLSAASLAPGAVRRLALPAARLTRASLLVVYADWVAAAEVAAPPTLFVSYRPRQGPYDSDIPLAYSDGVLVHSYNGTSQIDAQPTRLHARLYAGDVWWDAPPDAVVAAAQLAGGAGGGGPVAAIAATAAAAAAAAHASTLTA